MNWTEIWKRFGATVVYAALGAILGSVSGKINITLAAAALFAGVHAAITFVSLLARDVLGLLKPDAPIWEKVLWTFIQATFGALASMPLGTEAIEAAVLVGATSAINLIYSGLGTFLQMPVGDPPPK